MIPLPLRLLSQKLTIAFGAIILACNGCKHDHPEGKHQAQQNGGQVDHHRHGNHPDLENHSHSPGHTSQITKTFWTQKTELHLQYEPLISATPSRFTVHLTDLSTFQPVDRGALEMSIRYADGAVLVTRAEEPAKPGIFRFSVTPEKSGKGTMTFDYHGPQTTDVVPLGITTIYKDAEDAHTATSPRLEKGISFDKQRQWQTDFATNAVSKHELQPSVRATGEVRPVAGREARLTAPARGRIVLARPTPLPGSPLKKRQLLATLSPYLAAGGDRSTLEAEAQSAAAEHAAAVSGLGRVEQLFREQAISQKRVEQAQAEVSVTRARLSAANGRLRQYKLGTAGLGGKGAGAFQLRSSIDGTLVETRATSGDSVEEGTLLFVVIDLSRVWLVAKIFEPDIPKIEAATSAWFTIEGYEKPFTISEKNGRLVSIGRVIDAQNRTVPVIFEMENPDGKIRIGQFAEVFIATGNPQKKLAIPEKSLLDDGGVQIAFVQVDGETFERRVVKTGIRSQGMIELLSGVKLGERVVTKGAYELHLAAASGVIPTHGHVH